MRNIADKRCEWEAGRGFDYRPNFLDYMDFYERIEWEQRMYRLPAPKLDANETISKESHDAGAEQEAA